MTVPRGVSVEPGLFSLRERLACRVAVAVAVVLAKRKPRHVQAVLGVLRRGARPATYAQASRARAVVTGTSLTCTGPQGCLPRSIATAVLCRMGGGFPVWTVGVRVVPPFGAHAWVVAEGRDVDEPYPQGYHAALVRVGPS